MNDDTFIQVWFFIILLIYIFYPYSYYSTCGYGYTPHSAQPLYLRSNIGCGVQADVPAISFDTVQDRIDLLKSQKAAGHDGIIKEHKFI